MPICRPERPQFASGAESRVWGALKAQLPADAVLISGLRITDHAKDHEADVVVMFPGAGIVVVEVKGGSVWHENGKWHQRRSGKDHRIDPVGQARGTRYALRRYVEEDPRWRRDGRQRVRWAHAVVLPNTELPAGFSTPDCPRWSVVDRTQLGELAQLLRAIPDTQETSQRRLDADDATLIVDILRGRGLPQRDLVALADERDSELDRLTQEQAVILGATRLLRRVEVRGGAGSGKTWLAVEQARRLAQSGERVALMCYSRGLASYLRRYVEQLPRRHRPAYVGEFHALAQLWGATPGSDDDSDYWENRLPDEMVQLATALPDGQRFDAVIVDEAQDFADSWWPVLLAALKDPETGGVFAFSDEGQRVFARYGQPPVPLVPLVLDQNLRNTKQIADVFNPLAPMRMRLVGGDGPEVQLIEVSREDALSAADDAVDGLLDAGWRPVDIALLTTGSRHPEQTQRQAEGQDEYWASFWDKDLVFYGHVLGFKGLERRIIVLAVNEKHIQDRSRERMYVGLSRARDQLIVCGDPCLIAEIAGDDVLRRLRAGRLAG